MSYFHDVEGPATHPIITAVDPRGPLERKYINVDESHLCGQLSQPTTLCCGRKFDIIRAWPGAQGFWTGGRRKERRKGGYEERGGAGGLYTLDRGSADYPMIKLCNN